MVAKVEKFDVIPVIAKDDNFKHTPDTDKQANADHEKQKINEEIIIIDDLLKKYKTIAQNPIFQETSIIQRALVDIVENIERLDTIITDNEKFGKKLNELKGYRQRLEKFPDTN